MRVALYVRVNTLDKAENPETQLNELREVAAQRSWEIAEAYVDNGKKISRPALDKMLADVRAGRFDLVATWTLDRLTRSYLLSILTGLQAHRVGFVSLGDACIGTTTPSARLALAIAEAFAAFRRAMAVEPARDAVVQAQSRGKHGGRPVLKFDPRAAQLLWGKGYAEREVARMLAQRPP